ncbi:MAG: glycosyltransferase family 2 protein [Chitinophagales bacterium]
MKISVIIPVYNAEKFVEAAVLSALAQPETDEVILIEDASTDNSAVVCAQISEKYDKVKLLKHPDGRNHGAGASRNLGIAHAANAYIAFLDADDYYLSGRFTKTKEVFNRTPDADGVYGCLGIHFENAEAESLWKSRFTHLHTRMQEVVLPAQLARAMSPLGTKGWFSIDTLTVKKHAVEKAGGFGNLPLSQDTEFLLKLAITCRLYTAGNDVPIAVRRVHAANRITSGKEYFYRNRIQLWLNMIAWSEQNKAYKKWRPIFKRQYIKSVFIYVRYKKGWMAKCSFIGKSLLKIF